MRSACFILNSSAASGSVVICSLKWAQRCLGCGGGSVCLSVYHQSITQTSMNTGQYTVIKVGFVFVWTLVQTYFPSLYTHILNNVIFYIWIFYTVMASNMMEKCSLVNVTYNVTIHLNYQLNRLIMSCSLFSNRAPTFLTYPRFQGVP